MRIPQILLLALLFFITSGEINAQNTDSLENAIESQDGIEKVRSIIEYGKTNFYRSPQKTADYCHEAKIIARGLDSIWRLGQCLNIQALSYNYLRKGDTAIRLLYQAEKLLGEIDRPRFSNIVWANLGQMLSIRGDYEEALIYFLKSLQYAEQRNDSSLKSKRLSDIGNVYIDLQDYPNALKHQFQAYELAKDLKVHRQIGAITNSIGYIYDELKLYDSALVFYQESIRERAIVNDQIGLLRTQTNMCVVYRNLKQTQKALDCNYDALELSKTLNRPDIESINLLNVGINLSDLKMYEKSNEYTDSALMMFEYYGDIRNQREALGMLVENSEKLGEYQRAFQYHTKFKIISDSLSNSAKYAAVEELREKYENEKVVAENKLLEAQNESRLLKINKRNNTILALVIGAVILFISLLVWFRKRNAEQKALLVEKELDKQISVNNAEIKSREEERKRISKELHDGVGQQLTAIHYSYQSLKSKYKIENNLDDLIAQTANNIRTISHQMMPKVLIEKGLSESLRNLVKTLNDQVDTEIIYHQFTSIPEITENVSIAYYRIAQECLSNALKHSGASKIDVMLNMKNHHLVMQIEDNGKGFNGDFLSLDGHGIYNMKNRAKSIGADLKYESELHNGTKFILRTKIT